MNKMSQTRRASAPRRPLRADFTTVAMRRAVTAQRRASQKQRLHNITEEFTRMKATRLLRTAPGAALGLAVVATGSVGVYALTNWFGGNINITQKDNSTFSIDLGDCKGAAMLGIEPSSNLHNVQFKILGNPHVDIGQFKRDVLGICESNAVREFYASKYPDANFNIAKTVLSPDDPALQYVLLPATVVNVTDNAVTLSYSMGKGHATAIQKTLPLAHDVTVFDASKPAALSTLQPGDTVMAVAYSAGAKGSVEGTSVSVLDNANVQVKSLFKTQYNDADDQINYEQYNIMPLEMYNQLHKK